MHKQKFMKTIAILALGLISLSILGCKSDTKKVAALKNNVLKAVEKVLPSKNIKVVLESKSTSKHSGNIVSIEKDEKGTMTVLVSGLEEGQHAVYSHKKADGNWGDSARYPKGRVGNFDTDDKGNSIKTPAMNQWCTGYGDPKKELLDKAIVIHNGLETSYHNPVIQLANMSATEVLLSYKLFFGIIQHTTIYHKIV